MAEENRYIRNEQTPWWLDQAPFLKNWRTDTTKAAVGVICNFALIVLAYGLSSREGALIAGHLYPLALFCVLAIAIAGIVYAHAFYPTLFFGKPKLKDANTVSLLNGLFGGALVGWWLCAALTRSRNEEGYVQHIYASASTRIMRSAPATAAVLINVAIAFMSCMALISMPLHLAAYS